LIFELVFDQDLGGEGGHAGVRKVVPQSGKVTRKGGGSSTMCWSGIKEREVFESRKRGLPTGPFNWGRGKRIDSGESNYDQYRDGGGGGGKEFGSCTSWASHENAQRKGEKMCSQKGGGEGGVILRLTRFNVVQERVGKKGERAPAQYV